MRLSVLLQDVAPAAVDVEITALALDSRKVTPGSLFFACKGTQADGSQFIQDAITRGASAVVIDVDALPLSIETQVPIIAVGHLQQKIGHIASRFYHDPSRELNMMGITGTNGKTSCSHFIAQMLQSFNISCGIIGTLGSGFYGALGEAGLTTPDAISLQAMLRDFVKKEAQAVAMEVSSHSIHQGRVNGVEFNTAIFTNLTQDHLDYHGDMQTYAKVKRRLFAELASNNLIINADDEYGLQWIHELAPDKNIVAYGTQSLVSPLPANVPYVYAEEINLSLQGITALVHTPWGSGKLQVPLIGQFNLSNVLAVLTTLCLQDIPLNTVLAYLTQLKPVPGRMQTLGGKQSPLIVVDYAHTPDALEKVLQALRAHTQGKLICVFGCGGDRDQAKRPLMAAIAERLADTVIVTNDNPRHEAPEIIVEQINKGFSHPERVLTILDRAQAIKKSIQLASHTDCVLIAGKGAERYQQIGDVKTPFDDVKCASQCLEKVY